MNVAPDLRAVVADVVREVVADLLAGEVEVPRAGASAHSATVTPAPPPPAGVAGSEYVTAPRPRERSSSVRIVNDADLEGFARLLLALYENPKTRQDLRAGRLRFRLEGGATATTPDNQAVDRIDTGAVTERHIKTAADAGRRLVLGRRAVLTPLAREKARALGVPIEKER